MIDYYLKGKLLLLFFVLTNFDILINDLHDTISSNIRGTPSI